MGSRCFIDFRRNSTRFRKNRKIFAFEHYDMVPDVLVMGKDGRRYANRCIYCQCRDYGLSVAFAKFRACNTFGGNPVVAAAALATLQELLEGDWMAQIDEKENSLGIISSS